jgi:hypothetical protein
MGPVQPPPRKGRLPQYAPNKLVELQHKFDELESLGIFQPPENLGITVEYLNPSLLIEKSSGGHRLVTDFADVGRYSKPEPRLSQSPFWNTDFSSLLRAFFDRPVFRSEVGRGVFGGVSLF